MRLYLSVVILSSFLPILSGAQPKLKGNKARVIHHIEQRQADLIRWNDLIWQFAEPSFEEKNSVDLLVGILKKEGFTVEEKLCGFSTVFIATYGKDQPVIGLFGEYDADPGASNKVLPRKEELLQGGYGHGGHHNVLGVGSLGAALAIKDLIRQGKLKCTIRYYGTTAEGGIGTKTYLARDGYFDDLDLSLYWHPSPVTSAPTRSWDALIDLQVAFSGKEVHAFRGRNTEPNALNAVELFLSQLKSYRERMTEGAKLNYRVEQWPGTVDVIPDSIKLDVRIQCAKQTDALNMLNEVRQSISEISAKTKVESRVKIKKAVHQFLPNVAAMQCVQKNIELAGPIGYTAEERQFTKELQRYLNAQEDGIEDKVAPFSDQSERKELYGYVSDIGDASWIAPEIYFVVRTLPPFIPMHRWTGTVFSAHSIGHKGMLHAAKILSFTIIDFVENESLRLAIKKDWEKNTEGYRYQSLLTKPVGVER